MDHGWDGISQFPLLRLSLWLFRRVKVITMSTYAGDNSVCTQVIFPWRAVEAARDEFSNFQKREEIYFSPSSYMGKTQSRKRTSEGG